MDAIPYPAGDSYFRERADGSWEALGPFDPRTDCETYVDGKPRPEGVRSFPVSRGIELPQGSPHDPPGEQAVDGLGTRKNTLVSYVIREPRTAV